MWEFHVLVLSVGMKFSRCRIEKISDFRSQRPISRHQVGALLCSGPRQINIDTGYDTSGPRTHHNNVIAKYQRLIDTVGYKQN